MNKLITEELNTEIKVINKQINSIKANTNEWINDK